MNDQFDGLTAIVQYRKNPDEYPEFDPWHNMAAFDVRSAADRYAADCTKNKTTWIYRVIDVVDESPSPKAAE